MDTLYPTLLTLGVILIVVGLVGQIKAKEIEVGTENPVARIVLGIIEIIFVVIALQDLLPIDPTSTTPTPSPTSTHTVTPTSTPTPTPTDTPTPNTPTDTPTPTPTDTPTPSPTPSCIKYDQVNEYHIGKTICVWGIIKKIHTSDSDPLVIRFIDKGEDTFLYKGKNLENNYKKDDCIQLTGIIKLNKEEIFNYYYMDNRKDETVKSKISTFCN